MTQTSKEKLYSVDVINLSELFFEMAKFTHLSKQAILERPGFRAFQIIPAFVLSCRDFVSPWITLPATHHCADSLIGRIYRNGVSACVVHIVLNLGTLGRVHVIQCKVKTT